MKKVRKDVSVRGTWRAEKNVTQIMHKQKEPCWNCDGDGVVIAHEDEPGAFPIVCPVCKGKEEEEDDTT